MNAMRDLVLAIGLPPLNLAFLAAAGLIAMRFRRRLGAWIVGLSIAGLLLLSLPGVSGALLRSLQTGFPTTPPKDNPPRAIVILSAETTRDAARPEVATIGRLTTERLRGGIGYARRMGLPLLVAGGTNHKELPPVAALMARSAIEDFRFPVRWIEDKSLDTWQNAQRVAEIMAKDGIKSVYVVTHAWHMRRALLAFDRAGLAATALPVGLDPPLSWIGADFTPRVSSWQVAYYAFHEWMGIAWYSLR